MVDNIKITFIQKTIHTCFYKICDILKSNELKHKLYKKEINNSAAFSLYYDR